jgi:hypothetical protein
MHHYRYAGSSKNRQPGLPGIGGEPGGPVYRESMVKRLGGAADGPFGGKEGRASLFQLV